MRRQGQGLVRVASGMRGPPRTSSSHGSESRIVNKLPFNLHSPLTCSSNQSKARIRGPYNSLHCIYLTILPWPQNLDVLIPMEAAITEIVSESSSSRRLRPKQSRKSLAESPPSQLLRKSQQKRKQREEEESSSDEKDSLPEGYWKVRGILDEKFERGELRYLVDWEDNRKTGESYKPTWVWAGCLVSTMPMLT